MLELKLPNVPKTCRNRIWSRRSETMKTRHYRCNYNGWTGCSFHDIRTQKSDIMSQHYLQNTGIKDYCMQVFQLVYTCTVAEQVTWASSQSAYAWVSGHRRPASETPMVACSYITGLGHLPASTITMKPGFLVTWLVTGTFKYITYLLNFFNLQDNVICQVLRFSRSYIHVHLRFSL